MTFNKLRLERNFSFLLSTANMLMCEMLDAFPFKTGTNQRCMLSLGQCKNSLEHRVRTVHTKGNKKYEY